MPSPDSNRDNAKHSTGPRSTKGKQASALNSTKHGLRAQFTFANPGYGDEEKQKYARLVDALTRELDPQGVLETALVCQIAQCRIRLDRAMKCENAEVEKKMMTLAITRRLEDASQFEADLTILTSAELPSTREEDDETRNDVTFQARTRTLHSAAGISYVIDLLKIFRVEAERGRVSGRSLLDISKWSEASHSLFARILLQLVGPSAITFEDLRADQSYQLDAGRRTRVLDLIDGEIKRLSDRMNEISNLRSITLEADIMAAVLPSSATLDRLLRYETAIQRQLYRALEELERLQSSRRGGPPRPTLNLNARVD